MAFANNITQTVQKAFKAYVLSEALPMLAAQDASANVFTSILAETAPTPNVLIKCAKAMRTDNGNWRCQVDVEYRENADVEDGEDPAARIESHHERAGELFSVFMTSTIAADLSNALANFTCFLVAETKGEQGWRTDGRLWISYLQLECEVCGTDIV